MTALIESLNKLVNKTSKSYLVYLNLINSDYFLGFQIVIYLYVVVQILFFCCCILELKFVSGFKIIFQISLVLLFLFFMNLRQDQIKIKHV